MPGQLERALKVHGDRITQHVRVVHGDEIVKADGNVKEKAVDALLVADLVYHAAMKNIDYALLVSVDTDFSYAIRRVEDFGCRTGVLALCSELPSRLREACDDAVEVTRDDLLGGSWAVEL